ncbi:MAG: hypothetical protein ABI461_00975 [Polyangiaceae bacterium]
METGAGGGGAEATSPRISIPCEDDCGTSMLGAGAAVFMLPPEAEDG